MDVLGVGFKSTFGFRPSRVEGMSSHEQELVNGKLKELAESFQYWSANQSKVRAGKPLRGKTLKETRKNLRVHAEDLKSADRMILSAKNNFWRAHKLAENRGYYTQAKHTDYLPRR